jgi:hypothetical protein
VNGVVEEGPQLPPVLQSRVQFDWPLHNGVQPPPAQEISQVDAVQVGAQAELELQLMSQLSPEHVGVHGVEVQDSWVGPASVPPVAAPLPPVVLAPPVAVPELPPVNEPPEPGAPPEGAPPVADAPPLALAPAVALPAAPPAALDPPVVVAVPLAPPIAVPPPLVLELPLMPLPAAPA